MREVVLNYDDITGAIYDGNGAQIMTWVGLVPVKEKKQTTSSGCSKVDEILKLKAAGFDKEEISLMLDKVIV